MIEVINIDKNETLTKNTIFTRSFFSRLKGLLFKDHLPRGQGMMIHPCKMIHTFGMRFSIDAVFISKEGKVIYMLENFPKGRISPFVYDADRVLELPAGRIKETNTKVGDALAMVLTHDIFKK